MPAGTVLAADWAPIIQTVYAPFFPAALNRISFLWGRLNEMGKVRRVNRNRIDWRVNSEGHGNVTSINDGETLPSPGKQATVNPQLLFKIQIATIAVGRQQQRASFGIDSSVQDALLWETERTIEDMARDLHLQIAGPQSTTKRLTSLEEAISATGTYAGISRAANPFWQSFVDDNGGANRPLTEALLENVNDTLKNSRGARPTEVWCGIKAWNALRTLIQGSLAPARNNDPTALRAGALSIEWEGLPFIKVPDIDTNKMFFVDLVSDGGIELLNQADNDFIVTPESTDAFDTRLSISNMMELVVWNPFKQGLLADVA